MDRRHPAGFANDLADARALVAVTDDVNQAKSDQDPAEWMPPSTCRYVREWVAVKLPVAADVDAAERDALAGYLNNTCAGRTTEIPARASVPDSVGTIPAYVTKVYLDLFGRNPDPTGLAGWTAALQNGTPYGAVANSITASPEFRSGLINESYAVYLGRGADPSGLGNWLTAMNQGLHIEQMQAGFIASPEFYARYGGTDAGVDHGPLQDGARAQPRAERGQRLGDRSEPEFPHPGRDRLPVLQ